MEGITVGSCSLDGSSRQTTNYLQLLSSLANSDVLSSTTNVSDAIQITNNSSFFNVRSTPLFVQHHHQQNTCSTKITTSNNSNLDATRTNETLLCAYDQKQKTLTILGSTNFGGHVSTFVDEAALLDEAARIDDDTTKLTSGNKKTTTLARFQRSGWPKGKKRRKLHPTVKTPKHPATAYNLFCAQRRSVVRMENADLPLPEVTKILGKEWSALSKSDKRKYFDAADLDMERYKGELDSYISSSEYQEYLQKTKRKCGGTSEDVDRQQSIQQEEQQEQVEEISTNLFCEECNVYFHNLHNKMEHLKGQLHRHNTVVKFETFYTQSTSKEQAKSQTSSIDYQHVGHPVNMEEVVVSFFELNRKQELEYQQLKERVEWMKTNVANLHSIVESQNRLLDDLRWNLKKEENRKSELSTNISALNYLPNLFNI